MTLDLNMSGINANNNSTVFQDNDQAELEDVVSDWNHVESRKSVPIDTTNIESYVKKITQDQRKLN